MATLQVGVAAYRRLAGEAPEIKLINRFVEASPTNLAEHSTLIARPPTTYRAGFPPDVDGGLMRGNFSNSGSFSNDLFVVSGKNFYRWDGTTVTHISGEIQGTANPKVAFVRGAGYEYLFIADGLLLQYYAGTEHAFATATWDGVTNISADVINIDGTYYGWNAAVDTNAPDGTAAHPFLANPGTDLIQAMANMLNFAGTPGIDFSTALGGPSTVVTAVASGQVNDTSPQLVLTVTAIVDDATGDAITVSNSGTGLTWSDTHLDGGGVEALHGVPMPMGLPALAVASLDGYTLVSIGGQQQFYFILPGETTIDLLNFASKEGQADPIIDMVTIGDLVIITGQGSTEFWAATGDLDNPFAPVEGRTLSRGCLPGTLVVINETTAMLVGNDFKVYTITSSPARVSDNGIEERIHIQIDVEQGLT